MKLQVSSVGIDVIPLFPGAASELEISDEDLITSSPMPIGERLTEHAVSIQHIPTGISFQSSGVFTFPHMTLILELSILDFLIVQQFSRFY